MLLRFVLRLKARGGYALFTMPRMLVRMLPHGHNAINRARALLTARLVPRNRRLRPRAHGRWPGCARRRPAAPLAPGEGFLTIVT
jgi:hypothetical protein